MICHFCAQEADGLLPDRVECPECHRDITLTPKGGVLHIHYLPPDDLGLRWPCPGYRYTPLRGHAACEGCDCRHQPVQRPVPGSQDYGMALGISRHQAGPVVTEVPFLRDTYTRAERAALDASLTLGGLW